VLNFVCASVSVEHVLPLVSHGKNDCAESCLKIYDIGYLDRLFC
jgi:hypothetical protein